MPSTVLLWPYTVFPPVDSARLLTYGLVFLQSIVLGEETKLDFNKIKEDLKRKGGGRKKLLLLQALRWVREKKGRTKKDQWKK